MVAWLTPDHGRIVTSIKGACRPKSAFLGQYDLGYTCDLLFYRREREGAHAARACWPVTLREPIRNHWQAAAATAYLTQITARTTPAHLEARELFRLLEQTLDHLAASPGAHPLETLLWYEIHLLRALGHLPDLESCPRCNLQEPLARRFSLPAGRLLCPHRPPPAPGEATLPLHHGIQALFLKFRDCPAPPAAPADKNTAPINLVLGLSRFLGIFMGFHLDAPPAVRRVAIEMMTPNLMRSSALQEK